MNLKNYLNYIYMVYAYGYKQKIITNLSTINESTNNFYNYKGLNFLSKLNSKNKNIVFFFSRVDWLYNRWCK